MPLTRYLILDAVDEATPRLSVVVGCTKAASTEGAVAAAAAFFSSAGMKPNLVRILRLADAKRTYDGESDIFWTKDSQFGVIYKCQLCLRVERGCRGNDNHWDYCPLYETRRKGRKP